MSEEQSQEEYIEELELALEQACRDLNAAHDELMKAQGCDREGARKRDWPEWTTMANTIRWAEDLLKKRLAKTNLWTRYPDAEESTESCASGPVPKN